MQLPTIQIANYQSRCRPVLQFFDKLTDKEVKLKQRGSSA